MKVRCECVQKFEGVNVGCSASMEAALEQLKTGDSRFKVAIAKRDCGL